MGNQNKGKNTDSSIRYNSMGNKRNTIAFSGKIKNNIEKSKYF
jgi:hypothetical protein